MFNHIRCQKLHKKREKPSPHHRGPAFLLAETLKNNEKKRSANSTVAHNIGEEERSDDVMERGPDTPRSSEDVRTISSALIPNQTPLPHAGSRET